MFQVWKDFFKSLKPEPSPPPRKLTEEEKRIQFLRVRLTGLDRTKLTYLWGIAAHYPERLQNPDPVTAAALARIAEKIGPMDYERIKEADPKDIVEACKEEMTYFNAGAWY